MKKLFLFILVSSLICFGANAQTTLSGDYVIRGNLQVGATDLAISSGSNKKLWFSNPSDNSNELSLYRKNVGTASELRALIGTSLNNDNRFVVGRYDNNIGNIVPTLIATAAGKVGINVDNPLSELHVNGTIRTNSISMNGVGVWGMTGNIGFKIQTAYGYLELGPQNDTYCHIKTDRSYFYFNKPLIIDGGTISTYQTANLTFQTGGTRMTILNSNGNVGIGVTNPQNKLDVNGTIRAKEVKVETGWADFVFAKEYKLPSIYEVKNHIDENKCLPDIPTEAEVKENGVNLGEMQVKLLQKIEELTLYVIQQQETIDKLKSEVSELKEEK